MDRTLTFLGAAKCVTGSRYLLDTGGSRVLVDCGLNQERDLAFRNWDPLPVPPDRLDAVLLTHAHLDHCGLLPRLVKQGFRGEVFTTAPTAEIARIVMLDSARIQVEDVEHKRYRHEQRGHTPLRPPVPLYTEEDAEKAGRRMSVVDLGRVVRVAGGLEAEFFEAGHILGSTSIRVRIGAGADARTILFSGDIGRWDKPFLNDPAPCDEADWVLIESTYGDRLHGSEDTIEAELRDILNAAIRAGGNVVIPSFAIERSQELLYYLNRLQRSRQVPPVPVYLDSPMATKVTEVFSHHPGYLDAEMRDLIARDASPFELASLVMARTAEESKAINAIRGTAVIIAGSGMCTGGRIKHHLVRNLPRRESTILFVGYQAAGTLGREILEGAKRVRVLGGQVPVRARVERIGGFSAHADRDELLRWASALRRTPKRAFVVHGEPDVAAVFSRTLAERTGWPTVVPSAGESVGLSTR
jgi:metallo-beta-lactamase family protein